MHIRDRLRFGVVVTLLLLTLAAGCPWLSAAAAARPDASTVDEPDGQVVWPVRGAVLRAFDPPATRYSAGHRGIDLDAAPGERVVAAMAGTVTFAGRVAGTSWVTVSHGAGLDTTYGDIEPQIVEPGVHVDAGEALGYLASSAAHLDWGARRHGEYLDPLSLFGRWRIHLAPLE